MTSKITIELTLSESGNSVALYCRETRTECTVHAGVAPLAVAELVRNWQEVEAAEGGYPTPADPLEEHEIRNAQWNALRQGRTLPDRETMLGNLRRAKSR